ncbi:E1 early protein [Bos taurus papillomavirus 31]|nr:E1 early protein [Bos taurus papillomavirus 31]
MTEDKGTNRNNDLRGDWFIEREAECTDTSDDDNLNDLENLFDKSSESFVELDENGNSCDEVDQGNSAALHNLFELQRTDKELSALKRKYLSPSPKSIQDLSPRLSLVSISPRQTSSKRRLFEDVEKDETASTSGTVLEKEVTSNDTLGLSILHSKNQKIAKLGLFKQAFALSFSDLTRTFLNNKTISPNWVAAIFGPAEETVEGGKILLEPHVSYLQQIVSYTEKGRILLYLFEFKTGKCRDTVHNLLCTLLGVADHQLLTEPPKIRSPVTAFYFYKKSLLGNSYVYGDYPDWLSKQTLITHQNVVESFELCKMVQWAYDNDFTEECEIAFNYAQEAESDTNAAAWLRSNSQAKHVKDCSQMVKLYKQQEQRNMTMSDYIGMLCAKVKENGNWKTIMQLLKYQEVNTVMFLASLRDLFSGKPKKHCLVLYGPSNTGKSYFLYSLCSFLKGKVITFVNSKSHFWLQPLLHAKVGLLDDATETCWGYFDTYMRTALDGNAVSVDCKFRAPVQMKLPPLLISTNVDLTLIDKYRYLLSRLMCFNFGKPCLLDDAGDPVFELTDSTWRSFFERLGPQLGLEINLEDGQTNTAFRCVPRETAGTD